MALSAKLLSKLVCPKCKGDLDYRQAESVLVCGKCKLKFEVKDDIPVMLLAEAKPGIAMALTLTAVSLIGYSAMVGAVGGEGLGDLGIRYGYQRFMPGVMLAKSTAGASSTLG